MDGKPVKKTYALGTKYKKVAEQKKIEYEKLYELGKINPFSDDWNLREFEKENELKATSIVSPFIGDLKRRFLQEKTNTTAKTKRTYKYIINQFMKHVGQTMPITKVNDQDIRSFCVRENLAVASQRNYLRHLKMFFNWVVDQNILEANPCNKVQLPKTRDNLVDKIIDEEDLSQLFRAFRKYQLKQKKSGAIQSPDQMQFWFKPLITLAFYTGLRRKEIIHLQWSHVNLEQRFLRVTDTKNGMERSVPIFDPLYWRLLAWKKFMGEPKKGLVFPSPKSTPKHQIALTGNNISKRFKFYATEEAKLKDSINFMDCAIPVLPFCCAKASMSLELRICLDTRALKLPTVTFTW